MLIANNLTLIKDNKKIFSNLGFCLSTSSCIVIRGNNGSGKTSLLKILAGISQASAGEVFWGEEKITDLASEFGGDSEFIGHKNFLKPELTIRQNLEFHANLNDSVMALNSALSFFAINDIADKKVKTVSAGQQKKAMLAKLLACPASVWFLDEPSINLDQDSKDKIHGLIKTRVKEGGIVVITTHDQDFCDLGPNLNMEDFK